MVDTNIELMKELTTRTLTGSNAWIFDPCLKESSNELTIITRENISLTKNSAWFERNYIVDRSFIDENEVRWVIDYKTSIKPEDQSEESFIATLETAHSAQLQKYANLFSDFEDRPIKKAIFAISLNKLIFLK
jgi:ATP-dependent exoDNAse (exonuclease V) beta subunit